MAKLQRLLVLWSCTPDPAGPIAAWSLYGPESVPAERTGAEDRPPYASVVAAMRDGWRVIQYPRAFPAFPGLEDDTNHLKHDFVLEKIEEIAHV